MHGLFHFGRVAELREEGQTDTFVGEGGRSGGRASRVALRDFCRHGRGGFKGGGVFHHVDAGKSRLKETRCRVM